MKAVCTSSVKGVRKEPVKEEACLIEDYGIEKDAHAGKWHRQVSLLSWEKVQEFNKSGAGVSDGDFGENLLVSGINFRSLPVGTRFLICPAEKAVHSAADSLTEKNVQTAGNGRNCEAEETALAGGDGPAGEACPCGWYGMRGSCRRRPPRADADWQGLPSFLRDQKACRGLHHADGRRVCEGCPGRDGEAGRPCPGASA